MFWAFYNFDPSIACYTQQIIDKLQMKDVLAFAVFVQISAGKYSSANTDI